MALILAALGALTWWVFDGSKTEPFATAPSRSVTSPAMPDEAREPAAPAGTNDELVMGLTALCEESGTSILAGFAAFQEDVRPIEPFEVRRARLSNDLSASDTAEHLYVAAVFEEVPRARAELLQRAIENAPTSGFILWGAFQMCSKQEMSGLCSLDELEQQLIDVDGDNSEAWIRIAANRYFAEDQAGALLAMQQAAASAESRIYWPETIEAMESALAAVSNASFSARASSAFANSGMTLPNYGHRSEMCRKMSAVDAEWADACLRYGQLLEAQDKTAIGVAIAQGLQRTVYAARNDADGVSAIELKKAARQQASDEAFKDNSEELEYLLVASPEIFHAFLAAIRSDGEIQAQRRFRTEFRRQLQEERGAGCRSGDNRILEE